MKTYRCMSALLLGVLVLLFLGAGTARAGSDEESEAVTQKQYVRAIQMRYASLGISVLIIGLAAAYALSKFNQSLKRDSDSRRAQAMTAPTDDFNVQGLSTGALWVSKPPDPESTADNAPPQ